jgi:hypothetical protein
MFVVTEEEKPRFVLAAEELALQQGVAWETVLATDRERASNSTYPGPDCLLPDDLERLFSSGTLLDAAQADHVAGCRGCAALLASATSNPLELQRILDRVKGNASAVSAEQRQGHRTHLIGEALSKTARLGSLVLAAGFATVLAAKHFRQK